MVSKQDVVKVLLDELVDPHLPKRIPLKAPPIEKQRCVAKQLHAVVLLYNYYHRKQYPQAEHLDFESFCKLALSLKPVLAWHMNSKPQLDSSELNECENQLSITEKAIQDACNLCVMLDASKTDPVIEGWEISKVSVLLLDSKKENCFLMFGSVNDGVWSPLEKDLDGSSSESKQEERKQGNKKRRIGTKPLTSEQKTSDSNLQKLAFSAVHDATGTKRSDLVVLGKYFVYSLSKAKTTACFFIVQCCQPKKEGFEIPVKELIQSLQGPLVEKRSGYWFTNPIVEYFHLLPYATIIAAWHSQGSIPSCLQSSISRSPMDTETEVSGNGVVASEVEDTSPKLLDCSDNFNSKMVGEIKENCERSTDSAKSSGKEVVNEIAPSKMEDTDIKNSDECSSMVCEVGEGFDRSTDYAKSSGKEVVNETASSKMEDTDIKNSDECSNMVCEVGEDFDRSTDYAKSSGKEVVNETASSKMEDTDIKNSDECSTMVCEVGEDFDRSTDSAKSSGKEAGNEIEPLKMGDTDIEVPDILDNHCNDTVFEIKENCDRNIGGKEVGDNGSGSSQGIDKKKTIDEIESLIASNWIKDKSIGGKEVGDNGSGDSQWIDKKKTIDEMESLIFSKWIKDKSIGGKEVGDNGSGSSQRIDKEKTVDELESLILSTLIKDKSIGGKEAGDNGSGSSQRIDKEKTVDELESLILSTLIKDKSIGGKEVGDNGSGSSQRIDKEKTVDDLESLILSQLIKDKSTDGDCESISDFAEFKSKEMELVGKLNCSVSRGTASVQNVLGFLNKRKENVSTKQRHMEELSAFYDKSINAILDGRENDVGTEVKMVNEFSNETCIKGIHNQEVQYPHVVDLGSPLAKCRKPGSATLSTQTATEELNAMCLANKWRHPTYTISTTDGGFLVEAHLKGMSFEYSCEGDVHSDAVEAKLSSDAKMVSRLRSMTGLILKISS